MFQGDTFLQTSTNDLTMCTECVLLHSYNVSVYLKVCGRSGTFAVLLKGQNDLATFVVSMLAGSPPLEEWVIINVMCLVIAVQCFWRIVGSLQS